MEKNIGRIWISLAIAVLVIVIWWQGDSLKAVPTKPGDEPFLIALTQLGILYIVALFRRTSARSSNKGVASRGQSPT